MFNINKILTRSLEIVFNYRILWVFGFILALTVGGSSLGMNGGGGNGSSSREYNGKGNNDDFSPAFVQEYGTPEWNQFEAKTPEEKSEFLFREAGRILNVIREKNPVGVQMVISLIIFIFVEIFLLSLLGLALRHTAEAASIVMVSHFEQTGEKMSLRQGWQQGWQRAWRFFVINLIANLPRLLTFSIVLLMLWWIGSNVMGGFSPALITSLVVGISLIVISALLTALVMVVLQVVRDFAWRASVLENTDARTSLGQAFALLRRQWKHVGLMWLVMLGINILLEVAAALIFLPLFILLALAMVGGLVVAVVPALATAGIASAFAPDYWPWAFALVVGLPIFSVVAFSPAFFVRGLVLLFQSSAWTLSYRELKTIEATQA